MSDDRSCADCKHGVVPGAPAPDGQRYTVEVCYHPKVRNKHGGYATSLARRHDDRCGPAGRGWRKRGNP
jgi:hypothetical protein